MPKSRHFARSRNFNSSTVNNLHFGVSSTIHVQHDVQITLLDVRLEAAMSKPASPIRYAESPISKSASPSVSSQLQLTPRSKVQALLADLDDDSDDELPVDDTGRATALPLTDISHNAHLAPCQDFEAQKEDPLAKPRGSLASRLFASSSRKDLVKSTSKVGEEENAYDRIKKQLLGDQEKEASISKSDEAQKNAETGEDEDEDDEDVPIRPRRREIHVANASENEDETLQSPPNLSIPNSSGLFLSPEKSPNREAIDQPLADPVLESEDSGGELPRELGQNARFLELVERKRQERLEKEVRETRQRKEKEERLMKEAAALIGMDDQDSEDNTEHRLTQQSRPTRKASKKAIEEMKRETQRMTRNMQLTHEARTRKKITKQSLFAKFNYRPSAEVGEEEGKKTAQGEKTGSSDRGSDVEVLHSTPPTSPSSLDHSPEKGKDAPIGPVPAEKENPDQESSTEEEPPTIGDLIYQKQTLGRLSQEEKSNTGTVARESRIDESGPGKSKNSKGRRRNLPPRQIFPKTGAGDDSDSELEVLPKGQRLSIWDRNTKQNQAHSAPLHALRALANLTSPSKQRAGAKAITSGELQTSLQQRARQQAKLEREERLQQLRDRGIIIQTTEEREKDEAEVLDILARAREADSKLSRKEGAAAKNEPKGAHSDLDGDTDDEGEWKEADAQTGIEVSEDSELDEDGDDEDEDDEMEGSNTEGEEGNLRNQSPKSQTLRGDPTMVDIQASEDDADSEDAFPGEDSDIERVLDGGDQVASSDGEDRVTIKKKRKPRRALILSDDEDELEVMATNPTKATTTPVSAKKTVIPGLPTTDEVPLGLTQIFAGTMDESQTREDFPQPTLTALDQELDSLAFSRRLPSPGLPQVSGHLARDSPLCVPDSQTRNEDGYNQMSSIRPGSSLHDSQSQAGPQYVRDSFVLPSPSQYSDFPDPTQDVGFQKSSPIFDRFANGPTSTMETVLLPTDTPVPRKKSRLVKRTVIPDLSDDEVPPHETEKQDAEFHVSSDIFDVMRKAAKEKEKAPVEFSKKKSNAKGMVEEQAEESEDEYAGLGGASDDESGSEDAEFAREMVDDNGPDADERQLAAFYA